MNAKILAICLSYMRALRVPLAKTNSFKIVVVLLGNLQAKMLEPVLAYQAWAQSGSEAQPAAPLPYSVLGHHCPSWNRAAWSTLICFCCLLMASGEVFIKIIKIGCTVHSCLSCSACYSANRCRLCYTGSTQLSGLFQQDHVKGYRITGSLRLEATLKII